MEPRVETGFLERLRHIVRESGGPKLVSERTGIPVGTLNKYLAGTSHPPFSNMVKIGQLRGWSLAWLATGEGAELLDPSRPQRRPVDDWTMRRAAAVVTSVYEEMKIAITPENVAVEAAGIYNDLMTRVADPDDQAEIEAALPQLRHLLRKRLAAAAAEPGSGKRSAS
ncbi:hypothetical protein H2509_08165 [Stappia sp. F7233]|uniref:HTH cro/C1-type domain-containing protein n=1 Tax=Stappia albiluteola TaxID=2758565 RepID=A0A839ADW2_9HYPH|nr:hypothetical protein [Stappia albiluteola]MBA5777102.1 hypothetical protein [Stappia albiluteola]